MYIIAEVIGAILGYGALVALTPTKYFQSAPGEDGLCVTNLHPSVSIVQGFFIEFIVTSVLVFFVCSIWDPRNKDKGDSASLKLGKLSRIQELHVQVFNLLNGTHSPPL